MTFIKLVIYSYKDKKILKEFEFNRTGVSIILGEKERQQIDGDSNGVGKTTFIELIRCLLGQKFHNKLLKSKELKENDIFVYMECELNSKHIFLGKSIKSQDGYIYYGDKITFDLTQWKKYEERDYRNEMHKILVTHENEKYPIKISSINEYTIRDEEEGFVDILRVKRTAETSTACLMYLCQLPYWSELEINNIKKEMKNLDIKKKYINSLGENIADIKISKKKLEDEITKLNQDLVAFDTIRSIEEYEKLYKAAKEEYSVLKKEMLKKEKQMKQYKNNLHSINQNEENSVKLLDMEGFYNQLIEYFPNKLVKSYEEVVEFHSFMNKNRGKLYEKNILKLEEEIKPIKEKIDNLKEVVSQYVSIINNYEFIIDYKVLVDSLNNKYKQISEMEYKINVYDSKKEINDEINELKTDILVENKKLQNLFENYIKISASIVEDFKRLVKYSYNQEGELIFEYNNSVDGRSNTGRINIHCSIPDEDSHGIKTMKIMMFDIVGLLSRLREGDIIQFLIHDGAMTIPDNKLAKFNLIEFTDNKLKEIGRGQYILTSNISDFTKEQIEDFYLRKYVIKSLDKKLDENRCMGLKFSKSK